MFALGQKRTHAVQQRMSALGQKRTLETAEIKGRAARINATSAACGFGLLSAPAGHFFLQLLL